MNAGFVDGWQKAMWAGFTVMAVLFVYVLVRGPQLSPAAMTVETAATDETVTR